jgi:transcriptional regulator with XRE-family HTH domain
MHMPAQIEPIYRALATRIEMLRTTLGVTQEELANRLGWARPRLADIETCRQRIMLHDVEKIATALSTTAKHLLRGIWT